MAILYWRVKLSGTWTWRRATIVDESHYDAIVLKDWHWQTEEEE